MKAFLMHRDRDFDLPQDSLANVSDLIQDLGLDILFQAMASDDAFLLKVATVSILASLHEEGDILYRQEILADCMEHPEIARKLYGIAVEAIEREKNIWGWMSEKYPEGTFHRCVEVLQIFSVLLKKLRDSADMHKEQVHSEGLKRFFVMLSSELSDEYLHTIEEHLQQLKFRGGILMSARLGSGNQGTDYILCRPKYAAQSWFERLRNWIGGANGQEAYIYEVDERDEAGYHALSELRTRGIAHIAAALAQSTDHILNFFSMLRMELGFYIGCLNLQDALLQKDEPFCFPLPLPASRAHFVAQGLYDVCLSLTSQQPIVGNDISADDKSLTVITGANRGGKSTLLRSVGLAQLMMQCGMFVPAKSLQASLSHGLFTHFKREEDASMRSGKLDEELSRLSGIVDNLTPNSMVLLNESFASTNEREGSEIARQIISALLEMRIRVFYVTHIFDLAHSFYLARQQDTLFLRAERLAGGQRTFRLLPGEPLPTSYGEDLYRSIFGITNDAHTS